MIRLAALAVMGTLAAPLQAQSTETAVPAPGMATTGSGPNGATLRCKDGSYPAPGAADAACDGKGGVLVRFPVRRTPQLPTANAGRNAPAARAAERNAQREALRASADTVTPEGFVPWRERRARAADEAEALRMPEGATLRCADGTWIVRDTTTARCAPHRGVELRVAPVARPPARPPASRPRGG